MAIKYLGCTVYRFRALFFSVFGLLIAGCSKVPPADNDFVTSTVEDKIGHCAEYYQGCSREDLVEPFIQNTLNNELTADLAIQIALLNNPKIQKVFEELEISRADLFEASLLSNPSFSLEVRYPNTNGLHTNIEYFITSSLLDIFLIPLRVRLAETEYQQTKLDVSNQILGLAFDVRETFYALVSERQKIVYIQSVVELTSINNELMLRQSTVGNINTLEFQLSQSRFLEAELELANSQAEIIRLTTKLKRLLGFKEDVCLILPEQLLEEIDYRGYDLCTLEELALSERLDLQIARFEIVRLSNLVGLSEGWTYSNLRLGIAGERETDGSNVLGPGFSGQLPIFNYGQAARMRLCAQLRHAQNRLAELEIQVRSEVREAHKLLMSYLRVIDDYRFRLIPMKSGISSSSEALYNVMGLGVDKLIENKRQEVIVNQNFTESVKNYLVARVALDRALGGQLFRLLIPKDCLEGDFE